MDPRYKDIYESDSHRIAPLQCKKNCGIRVGPYLLRLVSLLGLGISQVRGRVQFGSLLLKADQTNT